MDKQTPSERFFLVYTFLRGSPESVEESLKFILEHFVRIQELIGNTDKMIELFARLGHYLTSNTKTDTLSQIETTFVGIMEEVLRQAIRDEVNTGRTLHLSLESDRNMFRRWLNQPTESEPETRPEPETEPTPEVPEIEPESESDGGHGNIISVIDWLSLTGFVVLLRVIVN